MSQYDVAYYKTHRAEKRAKWDMWARTVKGQYTTSKNKAKYNNVEWDLSLEEYSELRNKSCHYCAGPLPQSSRGLDRLDNSKGYIKGNVVPCCYGCNNLKSDVLSEKETLEVVKLLQTLRGKELWNIS